MTSRKQLGQRGIAVDELDQVNSGADRIGSHRREGAGGTDSRAAITPDPRRHVSPVLLLGGQGYVGTALSAHLLATGFHVRSVDPGYRGMPGPALNDRRCYQDLSVEELDEFDTIILLAGHSTVGACVAEPAGAFANNVAGFVDLVHKLRGQRLIYASSISVYVRTADEADEGSPLPAPAAIYDFHKQEIERYARFAYPNSYGLRFGTVCGPAPNMRCETLLNCLVRSAVDRGRVEVANACVHRPLLGVGDLGRAVEAILTRPVPPGIYNLAGQNVRIGELAAQVAERFAVPLVEAGNSTPYDIRVSAARFRAAAGFEFHDTVENLADALAAHYRNDTRENATSGNAHGLRNHR